jgi:hypothetical protein
MIVPPGGSGPVPPTARPERAAVGTLALVLGLSAAAMAVVGSLLPYSLATWTTDGIVQTVTGSGWWTESSGQPTWVLFDGVLLVVGAIVLTVGVLWGTARPRAARQATLLVGLGAGLVAGTAGYIWLGIEASFRSSAEALAAGMLDTSSYSVGTGGWTLLAAGSAALLSALLMLAPTRPVDN